MTPLLDLSENADRNEVREQVRKHQEAILELQKMVRELQMERETPIPYEPGMVTMKPLEHTRNPLPQMPQYMPEPSLTYNQAKGMYAYEDERGQTRFFTESQLPPELRKLVQKPITNEEDEKDL